MCTVLLPPGVNPTAVNKYINITSYDTSLGVYISIYNIALGGGLTVFIACFLCQTVRQPFGNSLTFWRRNYYFFLILAHPVCKM